MQQHTVKLIECPRDAMQGIPDFIPTAIKAAYINLLLKVGFDTIDFGSFVSPKAIPQLRDTRAVLEMLDLSQTRSQLLAIVANLRGAKEAASFEKITYVGFPFSISETFQQKNTKSSIADSINIVKDLMELCDKKRKIAVVYISMGFGNPYGDPWNQEILQDWMQALVSQGAKILSLSDTTGVSSPEQISAILPPLLAEFSSTEIGLHLHSTASDSRQKIAAAYHSGCRRFDGALKGFGGCPMAAEELTGNLATEELIYYLAGQEVALGLDMEKWEEALIFSSRVFNHDKMLPKSWANWLKNFQCK